MDTPRCLYVHVPYCERKCPYCAFNSYAGSHRDEAEAYLDALLAELGALGPALQLETIYVGGGTPTALAPSALARLLDSLRRVASPREWTVEANPGTVTAEHIRALVAAGVNRISMGVQSMAPDGLKRMGRIHTADDVRDTVRALRESGIRNINLDLIYGQPDQDVEAFVSDVEAVLDLQPDHLSLYALQYEEGTAFTKARDAGRLQEASEDTVLAQFHAAQTRLVAAGFSQYEVSNFARPGRRSLHNLNYWRNLPYYGIGAGAWGCVDGHRVLNESEPRTYARRVLEEGTACVSKEELGPQETYLETLAAGLRTAEGVDLETLRERTGLDARVRHGDHLNMIVERGLGAMSDGRLVLTTDGLWVLDELLLPFA
ncbi:MAG: radical SAM family heme chaperone HemW [Planctomycetota bacterium]|nr:radical SAM family heme chaperone HemW [Planctomycetota bacterium]